MKNNTVLLEEEIAKVGGPIKIKPNSSKKIKIKPNNSKQNQDKTQVPNPLLSPSPAHWPSQS